MYTSAIATRESVLAVEDLHASYGDSRILHGVSLTASKGEVACLLGRNGVGKTTTLKSIMGLLPVRHGSVRINDTEVAGLAAHRIARVGVGYVPEERRIFPNLTVRENLLMGARTESGRGEKKWFVETVLDRFASLRARANSKGAHLSGGEQQMLAIGRALMGNPKLILVDEPTEGLAPVIVEVVEHVIAEIAALGVAIVLVESKLAVAERLAHKIYLMSKGAIVFEGDSDELMKDHAMRKRYLEV